MVGDCALGMYDGAGNPMTLLSRSGVQAAGSKYCSKELAPSAATYS